MKFTQLIAVSLFSTVLFQSAHAESNTAAAKDVGTVIVGSADFPESQLLATIYAAALTANNIKVEKKLNIGSREVYLPALLDGSLHLLPEYSGATLSYLDHATQAHSSAEVEKALAAALPPGIRMLETSSAQNSDVLAVTEKTARLYNLKTIDDLAPIAGQLVLGGPAEWKSRREGVKGLQDVYGLTFKSFKVLDVAGPLTLSALMNNQIQVADLTSTTPELKKNHLVALSDPRNLFLAQNIVPLIAEDKLNGTIETVLNKVSARLTTEDLIAMNEKLGNFASIDDVADEWLVQHGIKQ
ncbi:MULTISPECIES: ABC transporter substrate-binding protein [Brenneria]|uniref:ABC transporter substrate-binding protein n=1 Tax=Brenneria nigrifluens DSM 30175 = ATCC 13028 TaxID=1121120 RepID=A0A2U1UFD7_9GAMM|nr:MULTISPECIES: ABC transporter substrate-binding protein [Brenneria]EHD19993.1 ABC-type glycine betaine transport, periplasmic subunit [Brenneria sp. EniD312]PWC20386.1 glycine/betaine ABC transporter substrate-binding protein [Brenneria nigrifluens DSM 30175 = ATCC 13028]QCR03232.1 ABC transporter substrate-binding protein [Brenneria nigrifluens DSM 30175 = ATCC 13028]